MLSEDFASPKRSETAVEAPLLHHAIVAHNRSAMKQSLATLAESLGCRLLGDGSITVTHLSSLKSADEESLVFVDDAKHLDAALASHAAAVIAGDFAADAPAHKPLLISSQPRLAFARAARLLRDDGSYRRGVHPSATVPASTLLGAKTEIGARVVLG